MCHILLKTSKAVLDKELYLDSYVLIFNLLLKENTCCFCILYTIANLK